MSEEKKILKINNTDATLKKMLKNQHKQNVKKKKRKKEKSKPPNGENKA